MIAYFITFEKMPNYELAWLSSPISPDWKFLPWDFLFSPLFSNNSFSLSETAAATFTSEAFSIPSNPGLELTSKTRAPLSDSY
jgi:hypothetical protein